MSISLRVLTISFSPRRILTTYYVLTLTSVLLGLSCPQLGGQAEAELNKYIESYPDMQHVYVSGGA